MNTPYQPRKPKSSGFGSELLLAFLLLIALVQIVACFQASAGLALIDSPVSGPQTALTLHSGLPVSNETHSVTNAQPSGFHSVPTRG